VCAGGGTARPWSGVCVRVHVCVLGQVRPDPGVVHGCLCMCL